MLYSNDTPIKVNLKQSRWGHLSALAVEGLSPVLLEEAALSGGEKEESRVQLRPWLSQVSEEDGRACWDFEAWGLQKLTSILKKEKGQMKAGTEERRTFQELVLFTALQ